MVSRKSAVVGVIIGLVGAILSAILSPVFSPLSELVKDSIPFMKPPETYINSAKIFDNTKRNISKVINDGDTIPARAITFEFDSSKNSWFDAYYSNFECSF